MTVPPRLWDLALPAMALIAVVVLLNIDTDPSIVAAIILAAAFVLWLGFRLFAALVHILLGSNVVARIIAFGIAFLMFPEMALAPFQATREVVRYLSRNIPLVTAAWPQITSGDTQALTMIPKLVDEALTASDLPLRRVILGLLTWSIAGHLLSALVTHWHALDEATTSIGDRIQSISATATSSLSAAGSSLSARARSIPSAFWPASTVIIMLGIGIYLILGAIATIPYLSQQSASIEEMSARLATTLNGIQRTEMQFTSRHPVSLPDGDPFAALKEFVKTPAPVTTPAAPAPGDISPRPAVATARLESPGRRADATAPLAVFETAVRQEINRSISEDEQFRKSEREKWARMRQETWQTESKLRPNLEAQFTANLPSLRGTGEQTQFLDMIRQSYSAELNEIDRRLDYCWNAVQRVDESLQFDASGTIGRAQSLRNEITSYDDSIIDARLANTFANSVAISRSVASVDPLCDTYSVTYVPGLPQRGAGWGPLARIFDWLLATDSIDVVVIIGMLGAGLFGSAVGTFVTSKVRRRRGITDGDGAMSHLIRSFAATMVVYLGLKTGVAFAAVGNPDPDPYLMLFLCFIGTVYSDDVWDWARRAGRAYWSKDDPNRPVLESSHPPADGTGTPEAGHTP